MPDPLTSLVAAALLTLLCYLILRPGKGWLVLWQQTRQQTERVYREDTLKHIHKYEMKGRHPTLESVAGVLNIGRNETSELLTRIAADGLLKLEGGRIQLTPKGRESALHIIRAHRLWERYLSEETGFGEADWHGQAEKYEHLLTKADADALASQLGNPTHDPHGDPIPSASGDMVDHGGQPLTSLPVDSQAYIVHLEDEPDVVYAQLVAEGLHPGMMIHVVESGAQRVRFWANGDEHLLAPMVATNISVKPVSVVEGQDAIGELDRLASLKPGEVATVAGIAPVCRGAERRRFMDLGILPGTQIAADFRSPSGDPTAYVIRGALIALRKDQANLINIKKARAEA